MAVKSALLLLLYILIYKIEFMLALVLFSKNARNDECYAENYASTIYHQSLLANPDTDSYRDRLEWDSPRTFCGCHPMCSQSPI